MLNPVPTHFSSRGRNSKARLSLSRKVPLEPLSPGLREEISTTPGKIETNPQVTRSKRETFSKSFLLLNLLILPAHVTLIPVDR